MKFIKPSEISGKILSLLEESNEKVILVSPYINFSSWHRLRNHLEAVKDRGVRLEIFLRDEGPSENTFKELDRMRFEYTRIPHLHAKFYMNERYGIVTSLNLLLSSEINSLEIGYMTETRKEYEELLYFYDQYLHQQTEAPQQSVKETIDLWPMVQDKIKGRTPWSWHDDEILKIDSEGGVYRVSIVLEEFYKLKISCGLNQMEKDNIKAGSVGGMKLSLEPGPGDDIDRAMGKVAVLNGLGRKTVSSNSIKNIAKEDAGQIARTIAGYINKINELKTKA